MLSSIFLFSFKRAHFPTKTKKIFQHVFKKRKMNNKIKNNGA